MKKLFSKIKQAFLKNTDMETKYFKTGGYTLLISTIVLAILIAVNVLVTVLPTSYTKIDVTSNQLYSISYQTKKILKALDKEVTIYWISQEDEENETLALLLDRYVSMCDNVTLVKKDPDVYPNFASQYDADTENNSLVVECGDKYRFIGYDDIFSSSSYSEEFAGESCITSAIRYVTSEELPTLYVLKGHGEDELSDDYTESIELENIEVEYISLLEGSLSDAIDILLIYNPDSDISEVEKEEIEDYLSDGGSLILISELKQEDTDFTNLYALMNEYGMNLIDGIVIETNTGGYAWNMPYYVLPTIEEHDITEPIIEEGYYILLPIAQGLEIDENADSSIEIEELLTTSYYSYSKIDGYNITTYQQEDNDISGPFALALLAEKDETKVMWVSSASLLDDTVNSYVSGGNKNFFLNSLAFMADDEEAISIRTKTTSYSYLTMDTSTTNIWTIVFLIAIPLAFVITGFVIWLRRRHK